MRGTKYHVPVTMRPVPFADYILTPIINPLKEAWQVDAIISLR